MVLPICINRTSHSALPSRTLTRDLHASALPHWTASPPLRLERVLAFAYQPLSLRKDGLLSGSKHGGQRIMAWYWGITSAHARLGAISAAQTNAARLRVGCASKAPGLGNEKARISISANINT